MKLVKIILIVNIVLGFSPFNEAADLNYDSVIDILDVVIILNIILGIDG